ncbi:MAG: NAD(P)H-dependent oxidoreductase [Bacteroidales bacterium]|nr:NAD(P)H-dependent oxidoreductase [Bacteroidales bacterium]
MKKLNLLTILAVMIMTLVSCGPKKAQKVLVLYYSQTNNTKLVADEIANRLNADVEQIEAANPYDGDFMETIKRCMQEREEGVTPDIQPVKSDLTQYDVIFIGYPVWFGTYAPPVITFLKNVDLSGKKIVPFCTFGSGGLESSVADLKAAQPNAEVIEGYGVRAARLDAVPQEIDQFLKANGYLEGEYVKLDEFPEQQPVTEEEIAIFKAATDDYPMMHAEAKTVASRVIPGGTEYFFIAVDTPREVRDDMPPAGEMQVYVTVLGEEAPVFTKVVR